MHIEEQLCKRLADILKSLFTEAGLEIEVDGNWLVDEFGGFKWIPKDRRAFADNTWGYGEDLKDEEEFYSLLKGEVDAMLAIPQLKGWCYTQLTDVEQEQNGLYNFDRTPKFDVKRLRAIFGAARK